LILGSPAFGDTLQLAGERFQPKVSVVWDTTNVIPDTLAVYKVGTQELSKAVVSNVFELTGFKFVNRLNPKDKVTWEFKDDRERPRKFLRIVPSAGWVSYLNEDVKAPTVSKVKGVPTREEITALLYGYLPKFGISTNDLKLKPETRTEEKGQRFDKKGGTWSSEVVFSRGIGLPRKIDGIPVKGSGFAGGLMMTFANEGKVQQLEFLWRKYEPFEKKKTASKDELLERLKAGKAVRAVFEEDISDVTKFRVVGFQLWYDARAPMEGSQDLMFPFVELEMFGDKATNNVHFWVQCPILK
jgi:hypothetical protein